MLILFSIFAIFVCSLTDFDSIRSSIIFNVVVGIMAGFIGTVLVTGGDILSDKSSFTVCKLEEQSKFLPKIDTLKTTVDNYIASNNHTSYDTATFEVNSKPKLFLKFIYAPVIDIYKGSTVTYEPNTSYIEYKGKVSQVISNNQESVKIGEVYFSPINGLENLDTSKEYEVSIDYPKDKYSNTSETISDFNIVSLKEI